jgi:cysteine dioxygenase
MDALDWKDFLDEVQRLGEAGLSEDRLFDLVSRLRIDCALLAPYIQFSDDGYARNVLYRDDAFEAICLCWKPGQGTPVHDHGRSFGVVCVFEGSLVVTGFKRLDDGARPGRAELQPMTQVIAAEGTVAMDRVGSIHRLGNPPSARGRCVSLHFYAGPLDTMSIYDPLAGTVDVREMRGEPMLWAEPGADAMAAMI